MLLIFRPVCFWKRRGLVTRYISAAFQIIYFAVLDFGFWFDNSLTSDDVNMLWASGQVSAAVPRRRMRRRWNMNLLELGFPGTQ